MTTPFILEVSNVGKKYVINHQAEIQTLRDLLGNNFKKLTKVFHKSEPSKPSLTDDSSSLLKSKQPTEDFWAL